MVLFLHVLLALISADALSAPDHFLPEASGATKVNGVVLIAGDGSSGILWKHGATPRELKVDAIWDDMEGLAAVDETQFFAITSHSLTKKGKRRPEREQLFLLSLEQKITVKKVWSLREKILRVIGLQTSRGESLNIEGLAWLRGKLFLGLRAPLTNNGDAFILELKDALTNPQVERIHTLALNGKGVRGLETRGDELVVLSGSVDDTDKEFALDVYQPLTRSLRPLQLQGFHDLLRPESLVFEADHFLFVQDFETPANQNEIVRLGY